MNNVLNGFNVNEVTLHTNDEFKVGMAVCIDENCEAVRPADNERFVGICTAVNGEYISVTFTGILTVPFSGTEMYTGYNPLTAAADGNIRFSVSSSTEYYVISFDKDKKLMTFLLK